MSNIKDFVINNGVLEGYNGREKEVIIPDGITTIGSEAFRNFTGITKIIIPDGVEVIEDSAFSNCGRLESIVIPDSVKTIGKYAFSSCENLEEIVIPKGIVHISSGAFWDCKKLKRIEVPATAIVDEDAFSYCKSLTDENGFLVVSGVLYNYSNRGKFIDIPDTVKDITHPAFPYYPELETIAFPDSIKNMNIQAFYALSNNISFKLPKNITNFEGSALEAIWNCFNRSRYKNTMLLSFLMQLPEELLKQPKLSSKIKVNKDRIIDLAIKNDNAELLEKLLGLCEKLDLDYLKIYLKKVEENLELKTLILNYINQKYSEEQQEAYENDKSDKELGLKKRTLADWKKIYIFSVYGDEAVIKGYKGSATEVIVPEKIGKYKVIAVGDHAFSPDASNIRSDARESREKIEKVILPDGIKWIDDGAFRSCTNLTEIVIPDSIKAIGTWAFYRCCNLKEIKISNNITTIGSGAFIGCKKLTDNDDFVIIRDVLYGYFGTEENLTIPDNVKIISDNAFSGNKNIKIVTIPKTVVNVEDTAFAYCSNLTAITIPHNVTSIGCAAFFCCYNLESIVLPDNITSIRKRMFYGCFNLKTIYIPDTVTSIGEDAFSDCINLTIHTPVGSYAEKYAKERGIFFVVE